MRRMHRSCSAVGSLCVDPSGVSAARRLGIPGLAPDNVVWRIGEAGLDMTGWVMGLLLLSNAVLLLFLGWRTLRLQRLARMLAEQLQTVRHVPYDEAPDLERLLGSGERPVVVMDILNALELASKQSWFADKLGGLAPGMIRTLVYDQTAKVISRELVKFGVQAQVTVHRAA